MPSLPPVTPLDGLSEALPPWELDAESWIFPFWTGNAALLQNRQARPSQSFSDTSENGGGAKLALKQGLPQGAYHPLEDVGHIYADVFQGGVGGWMLYRYASSPVGPYDELIYVAGTFQSKVSGTRGLRITNIYVSTEASVWNGRRNWNIPKHVARFEWSHQFRADTNEAQTVIIRHPATSVLQTEQPIFAATLKQSRWMPRLPINTRILPGLSLYQPPLLNGVYKQGSHEAKVQRDTQPPGLYRATAPTFRGNATLAYVEPGPNRNTYGDGIAFPEAENTWGIGTYLRNVTVDFPWAKEYESKL